MPDKAIDKSEIVYCAHDDMLAIGEAKPHPDNPNKHPAGQVEILAGIIKKVGWRAAITISNRSGLIIRGHGRLAAAEALGLGKVPVDYQDYASEAEEMADLVADNTIPELSKMEEGALAKIIKDLDADDFDLAVLGISDKKLDKLLENLGAGKPKPEVEFTEELWENSQYLVLKFDNDIDWNQALTLFDVRSKQSLHSRKGFYKQGLGRVLDGAKAIDRIIGGGP